MKGVVIQGKVWKYGNDVNTDVIFPGKYTYTINDPEEMAKHAFENLDPHFAQNVKENDIIFAGNNFGCGSSREQAATCLKYAKIGAVVAKSFSRIYFRNAINMGLPLIQCPEAVDGIEDGEIIKIDFEKGELTHKTDIFSFQQLPEFFLKIIQDGGLIPHIKKRLSELDDNQ